MINRCLSVGCFIILLSPCPSPSNFYLCYQVDYHSYSIYLFLSEFHPTTWESKSDIVVKISNICQANYFMPPELFYDWDTLVLLWNLLHRAMVRTAESVCAEVWYNTKFMIRPPQWKLSTKYSSECTIQCIGGKISKFFLDGSTSVEWRNLLLSKTSNKSWLGWQCGTEGSVKFIENVETGRHEILRMNNHHYETPQVNISTKNMT